MGWTTSQPSLENNWKIDSTKKKSNNTKPQETHKIYVKEIVFI